MLYFGTRKWGHCKAVNIAERASGRVFVVILILRQKALGSFSVAVYILSIFFMVIFLFVIFETPVKEDMQKRGKIQPRTQAR